MENKNSLDRFINIAAGGKKLNSEVPRLEEIPPLELNRVEIEKDDCIVTAPPVFNEEKAYKDYLLEKENLKNYYRPFFKNHARKPAQVKTVTPLNDFLYRKEEVEDTKDFSRVLNFKGDFETVTIPHYVGPEGRWNAFYLKKLNFDNIDTSKAYVLDFEAVDYIGEVYINGRLAGRHEGFFAPFKVEITNYIHVGENDLVIVVKNEPTTNGTDINGKRSFGDKIYAATHLGYDEPELGWHHCPSGAGIIGKVDLVIANKQRVTDIFVRPNIDKGEITVKTTIFNYLYGSEDLKVFYTVEGRNFKETVFENIEGKVNYLSVNTNYLSQTFKLENFKLWTTNEPWLYQITVKITDLNGNIIDEEQTHFGMRKFFMDENSTPKGKFYLNNERIMLRGANEMGHLTRTVMENNDEQLFDDIITAKVCNLNYYRMTQRPVFTKVYDFFDMTGMLCQNDFPLFAYLKPSAVGEALKQVDEMELLVRNHPSVIVDTFCNETLDITAWGHEQFNLSRYDIEKFFNAAREVVHIANPDRVIKYCEGDYAPLPKTYGISDFHTYTFWYISHGLPSGKFSKGYLPPIRKDWMTGCGEYGADGLDTLELMRKYCPKDWLPESDDEPWAPNRIAKAQCYAMGASFFPEQDYIKDWIRESRKHQVFATKELTHILRRRADYIESTAIHLLIDAWPCGWTKTLIDVDRMPKPAFYAYKEALIPLRVSLRQDMFTVYSGDTIKGEVYALNDYPTQEDFTVKLNLLLNGKRVEGYKVKVKANGVSSDYIGEINYKLPNDFVGKVEIIAEAEGREVTYDNLTYVVKPKFNKATKTPVIYGESLQSIKGLCEGEVDKNIVFTEVNYFIENQQQLEDFAKNGGKLIVVTNRPLNILDEDVNFRIHTLEEEVGASNWVDRNPNSVYTKEFDQMDFKNFYNAKKDYQDLTCWFKFNWKGAKEVLFTYKDTGEEKYRLHKKHEMVFAEKKHGKGSVCLTTLSCIDGCVGYNPVLDKFIVNVIEMNEEL